jgi:basic amino acid/polyamine antiporter, APA family
VPGDLHAIVAQAKRDRERLDSAAIGPVSLTAIGIASVVGAGIFVTTGAAASEFAGPAVVISFVLAGFAAGITALCYAELAAMIPVAGSTYSYAYATFGAFLAWVIGWDLLLEYLFAASTVAVGWAGYADSALSSAGIDLPHALTTPPFGEGDSGVVNLPAVFIVFVTCGLLFIGMRESARANNALVALKLGVLIAFAVAGAFFVSSANLEPFVPASEGGFGDFGASGVLRAAGVVFFAYIGFDAVSTAAAEARNPQRTIPIGLIATVLISTVLYVAIGIVMTGLVDYRQLNVPDPIAVAVKETGSLEWLEAAVAAAAVIGLAATVLVTFYGQTRIFMRMSSDGMLPGPLGRVSGRFQTPGAATVVCAVAGALVAGALPIDILGDLVSIGTLLSFTIVCSAVLVLRRREPDLERPFRVPAVNFVASAAIVASVALIATLPVSTWIRLAVWLAIGLLIYFTYARTRTRERMSAIAEAGP